MLFQPAPTLPLWRFASLSCQPGLTHGVSTKQGGVSTGAYASLNLGGQDDPQAIQTNIDILRKALKLERMAYVRQVHGCRIVEVDEHAPRPAGEADGLCTTKPGLGLLIRQADCQAVILYSPQPKVLANLHVGWRGNVQNLPGRAVDYLARQYGAAPQQMWAAVSPGLGPCCAEFINYKDELPPDFWPYQVKPYYFDLWRITADQLIKAGVPGSRIEISQICTRCHPDFYSHRRKEPGRFGTVAALDYLK